MTGKSIAPKIYIACGISGSPQHMAGLRGAGTIVAINRDPEAPIHRVADISIVERIEDFIPEFIRAASDR
jgi:electron transfer flavoprotein alpha subunit